MYATSAYLSSALLLIFFFGTDLSYHCYDAGDCKWTPWISQVYKISKQVTFLFVWWWKWFKSSLILFVILSHFLHKWYHLQGKCNVTEYFECSKKDNITEDFECSKLIKLPIYEIKLANGWHIRSNYNVIFRWLYFILFYLFWGWVIVIVIRATGGPKLSGAGPISFSLKK